jgi:hypothetical protein
MTCDARECDEGCSASGFSLHAQDRLQASMALSEAAIHQREALRCSAAMASP